MKAAIQTHQLQISITIKNKYYLDFLIIELQALCIDHFLPCNPQFAGYLIHAILQAAILNQWSTRYLFSLYANGKFKTKYRISGVC